MSAMLHQRFAELESDVKLLVRSLQPPEGPVERGPRSDAALAQIIAAEQRRIDTRMRVCPPTVCDQTAWSIMLAAYLAHEHGKVLSVTALGSFGHAPATTALRWLGELVAEGFLISRHDETDGRRRRIAISGSGRAALRNYAARIAGD